MHFHRTLCLSALASLYLHSMACAYFFFLRIESGYIFAALMSFVSLAVAYSTYDTLSKTRRVLVETAAEYETIIQRST
jgi:hypothetical protein